MSESIEVVATFQAKPGQGDRLAEAVTSVLESDLFHNLAR